MKRTIGLFILLLLAISLPAFGADKLTISGGYMCDMSYQTVGNTSPAFMHLNAGRWTFDYKLFREWYRPLANAGLAQHRINPYCVGGAEPRSNILMPWVFVPAANAWDLRSFNEDYFTILRQVGIELNALNIQLMFCLSDQCQMNKEERRNQSPYYHNVNGVSKPTDKSALQYHAAFARKALNALAGLNVAYEIGNEIWGDGWIEVATVIIPELYAANVPPWNISLGAYMISCKFNEGVPWPGDYTCAQERTNNDEICRQLVKVYDAKYPDATHQVYWPVHGVGDREVYKGRPYGERFHQAVDWWILHNMNSNRIYLSTDGADHGDGKHGRPSPVTMRKMILFAVQIAGSKFKPLIGGGYTKLTFDFLPNGESTSEIVEMIDAMAAAYKEAFGTWPENRGKFPPIVEQEPTPDPSPDPTPGPSPEGVGILAALAAALLAFWKKITAWASWKRIRNVRRWTWQAWLGLLIVLIVLAILIF